MISKNDVWWVILVDVSSSMQASLMQCHQKHVRVMSKWVGSSRCSGDSQLPIDFFFAGFDSVKPLVRFKIRNVSSSVIGRCLNRRAASLWPFFIPLSAYLLSIMLHCRVLKMAMRGTCT